MSGSLRIKLMRDNTLAPIVRFDESKRLIFAIGPDPFPHTWELTLVATDDVTQDQRRDFQNQQGWDDDTYEYDCSVDDGCLVIASYHNEPDGFPAGNYEVSLDIDGFPAIQRQCPAVIAESGEATAILPVTLDPPITLNLDKIDPDIATVLGASTIEGMSALQWLAHPAPYAHRKACLLNILARLRSIPSCWNLPGTSLINRVKEVFYVRSERLYAAVVPDFQADLLSYLDAAQHFYRDGTLDGTHRDLFTLQQLGKNPAWANFRQSGPPSLQAVIALPPYDQNAVPTVPEGAYYVDIDIDLENPLQDVVSFIFHVKELADGGTTDQFELRKKLQQDPTTAQYLCYSVPTAT